MPKKSPRALILGEISSSIERLLPLRRRERIRTLLRILAQLYTFVEAHRYWDRYPRDNPNLRRPSFYHSPILIFAERGFRHYNAFRMHHDQLESLIHLIGDDPVFNTGSRKPQAPPKYQVGLLIHRLAHGHSLSSEDLLFGVPKGSVTAWSRRGLIALLRKQSDFISWPRTEERDDIQWALRRSYEIPFCVGIMDGFHVPLNTAPAREDAASFHSRKERYSLNCMAVVDNTKRFRYIHYGYPGSASDMRIQRACEPLNSPAQHFSPSEYLLADSGLAGSNVVVPMYRKSAGNHTLRGRKAYFNIKAARMRVIVEQSIGILKARFSILKSLPMRLRTPRDEAMAHAVIVACVMLHNALITTDTGRYSQPPPQDDEEDLDDLDDEDLMEMEALPVARLLRRREDLIDQMMRIDSDAENLNMRDWAV